MSFPKSIIFLVLITMLPLSSLAAEPFYLGGIQVNEPDPHIWVRTLKQARMNTVEVTVYAYQGNWDSDNLWFAEKDDGVLSEIRAAKKEGLRVVLILRVALDHAFEKNHFLWHGLIMPHTDTDLASWFRKYTRFVLHWARIAEQEHIDILGIASEMNKMTSTRVVDQLSSLEQYYLNDLQQQALIDKLLRNKNSIAHDHLWSRGQDHHTSHEAYLTARHTAWKTWAKQISWSDHADSLVRINQRRKDLDQHWRSLIRQTRTIYNGELTYAANFDQYQEVRFWDALDIIGINAYFKLQSTYEMSSQTQQRFNKMKDHWHNIFQEIHTFRIAQDIAKKPVLFTELGYTQRKNASYAPWTQDGFSFIPTHEGEKLLVWRDEDIDPQERADAVKALYHTHKTFAPPLLNGILYWKLSSIPEHKHIEAFALILNEEPPDPLQTSLELFSKDFY